MRPSTHETFAPETVVGVDGCRGGWVMVAARPGHPSETRVLIAGSFADVASRIPASGFCAVDVPVGLLDTPQPGGRSCDRAARKLLGRRASTVFSPPARSVLQARTFEEVRGHGMSRQSFGILPKVREVDAVMTPGLQDRIHEAHPEVAFAELSGAPLLCNKKTRDGREARLRALQGESTGLWGDPGVLLEEALKRHPRQRVAADDVLDALVLTWTAWRLRQGRALRLPAHPERDSRGLRMEICA